MFSLSRGFSITILSWRLSNVLTSILIVFLLFLSRISYQLQLYTQISKILVQYLIVMLKTALLLLLLLIFVQQQTNSYNLSPEQAKRMQPSSSDESDLFGWSLASWRDQIVVGSPGEKSLFKLNVGPN